MQTRQAIHGITIRNSHDFITTFHGQLSSGSWLECEGQQIDEKEILVTATVPKVFECAEHYVLVKWAGTSEGTLDLTPEEYETTKTLLRDRGYYKDNGDVFVFDDAEDEVNFIRFNANYKRISRQTKSVLGQIPIESRQTIQESPNEFITMGRHLGRPITSQYATYHARDFFLAEINRYCQKILGFKKSGKVDHKQGEYYVRIFKHLNEISFWLNGNKIFERKIVDYSDVLEGCIKQQEQHKKFIARQIEFHLASASTTITNVGETIKTLQGLRATIVAIDSKVKTENERRRALNKLNELIEGLKAEVGKNMPTETTAE